MKGRAREEEGEVSEQQENEKVIFNRWMPFFRRVHGNSRLNYPLWDGMDHMMVTNGGSKASGCYAVYPIP